VSRYSFSMPSHSGRTGWFRVGELEITTTALITAMGVISMFVYAISPSLLEPLFFIAPLVREGEVWRIVTWPIPNPPDIWTVIGLVFFWFVGHRVEDLIGHRRQAVLIAAMIVLPALVVTAIPLTARTAAAGGVGVLSVGFLVVLAVRTPDERWFFGIQLWILAAVYVAVDVLFLIGNRDWGYLFLELGVIAVACLGAAAYGILDTMAFVPRVGEARPSGTGRSSRPKRRRGRKGADGNVTAGPWAGSSAGPTPLESAELDVLLDKIGQDGIKSLSKEERRRLDELSKKMRGSG
jgi:hypothetical protein